MNRTTGTSLLVLGVIIGAIGAILYWAVTASTSGFDMNMAGLIMLWVGIALAVVGLIMLVVSMTTGNHSTYRRDTTVTPTGESTVEDRRSASSSS